MKLTCVTATFNCIKAGNRERLIRCVESVAKLKTSHEHLIYDGASTDGTVELLRELEAKTPGLRVVSEPDTGIYNALNKGVRDAQGEWFYVLGSDDYVCSPEVLDGVLAGYDCDEIVSSVRTNTTPETPFINKIFTWTPYCHQGTIVKTSRLRYFGGFDETYNIVADFDLILKFHENALDIQFIDSVFSFFSRTGMSSNTEKTIRELDQVIAKHFKLTPAKVARWRRKERLPTLTVFPYVWHGDKSLRSAARWAIKENTKDWLRILFHPLVVVTRPLRHRHIP